MNKTAKNSPELRNIQPEVKPRAASVQPLADRLKILPAEERKHFLLSRSPAEAAEILWRSNRVIRSDIVHHLDNRDLAAILTAGAVDWAADELRLLPPAGRARVLARMEAAAAARIKKLLSYPPDTAGARMSPEVVPFNQNLTVAQAVEIIRRSPTPVFHCYVVDKEGKLLGVVPMRKLVVAPPETVLSDLMTIGIVSVSADMDQEEVVRIATRRAFYALPVVDREGVLVGTITLDKVLQVIQDEDTEDIFKMAGTDKEEITSASLFHIAWIRAPWLFASFLGGLGAALIIGVFEQSIARVAALAMFLPIVLGMGGNIGVQSATVVVRGLAMGYIDVRAISRTVLKEMGIGFILGITYGLILGLFAMFRFMGSDPPLGGMAFGISFGFTVGIAIICSMFIAGTTGAFIPMVLKKINIDPAIATGPFVTTSIDILGIIVYFLVAQLFLADFL